MFKQLLNGLMGLVKKKSTAEKQWQELIKQGFALYQQGYIQEAMLLEERALELARKIYPNDHDNLATSINNLADLYRSQEKYSAAEPLIAIWLAMQIYRVLGRVRSQPVNNLNWK